MCVRCNRLKIMSGLLSRLSTEPWTNDQIESHWRQFLRLLDKLLNTNIDSIVNFVLMTKSIHRPMIGKITHDI